MRRSALPVLLLASCLAAPVGFSSSAASAAPTAEARAEAAVRKAPHEVVLDRSDRLVARDALGDPDGTMHVRFDRVHADLPVLGGDLVVHQAADGRVKGVSATVRARLQLSLTPSVSAEQAQTQARGAAANGARAARAAQLQIDAREAAPRLVWSVVVEGTQPDGTPSELLTLVDARHGHVVAQHEQIETVSDDQGLHVGAVQLSTSTGGIGFLLQDPSRGDQRTTDMRGGTTGLGEAFTSADDAWGGQDAPGEQVAVDAHYGAAKTLDYFRSAFGRDGIDGAGRTGFSRVHYGSSYNNAFWSNDCFCMTYGDGDGVSYRPFTQLDVAGHEMAHGITRSTANLTYSGESGGLNEATSDIFGTMVEHFANDPANSNPLAPGTDSPDYTVGELLRTNGLPLRYMAKPSLDGRSADCWSTSVRRLDVHYSSGVGNHFFYLLANGGGANDPASPTCDGSSPVGIGKELAARIWYEALTKHMTSTTNYALARQYTITAALDLENNDPAVPRNLDESVASAWTAVGVTPATKGGRK